ncbi:DNA polymerase, partial [Staphylococcus epidermidis]
MYFHNLKFDGAFWLSYLMDDLEMQQALYHEDSTDHYPEFIDKKKMQNNTFEYVISDMGQWYTITIKTHNHYIELRDSLKLLPFSVKRIGESFKTKHKKLDMEYVGFRYAGCEITKSEKEYIANDVLVVKEALEFMFNEGHNKLTIGSCCLSEYKKIMGKDDYNMFFPDLTTVSIDSTQHKYTDADQWIRKSYKGGWCYVVKGKENKVKRNGTTGDVNSLYPSMMSSESGNYYPVGLPTFWVGDYIPDEARKPNK